MVPGVNPLSHLLALRPQACDLTSRAGLLYGLYKRMNVFKAQVEGCTHRGAA